MKIPHTFYFYVLFLTTFQGGLPLVPPPPPMAQAYILIREMKVYCFFGSRRSNLHTSIYIITDSMTTEI